MSIELLQGCGGYAQVVDLVVHLGRALRNTALRSRSESQSYYWELDQEELNQEIRNEVRIDDELLPKLKRLLECSSLFGRFEGRSPQFSRYVFQPLTLARVMLGDIRPDHELRYFVMVSIRKRWKRALTPKTAHEFQVLTDLLNSAIKIRAEHDRNPELSNRSMRNLLDLEIGEHEGINTDGSFNDPHPGQSQTWSYRIVDREIAEIVRRRRSPSLHHLGHSQSWSYHDIVFILSLAAKLGGPGDWKIAIELFLECCLAVNYLQAGSKQGRWMLRTSSIDSAFLMSNLFGMKTGISGFDELFGGGGLMLSDGIIASVEDSAPEDRQIGGRAILSRGRYGTGKSMLCLQFALEVARKGGVAYVMTVEQSPEECLYALGSVCPLPPPELVDIALDAASARRVLRFRQAGRGALVLIHPLKDSFKDFKVTFARDLATLRDYDLRLVIVDAVSAIPRAEEQKDLRAETLQVLYEAKNAGTNIWLVAEEGSDESPELLHYENVSDTVIRLSSEQVLSYAQRYFEIAKSRFQREQRGKHPFSISPGEGITIFPSAAAVNARIQPRAIRPPDTPIQFGLPVLDEILGPDGLFSGDVIVLQGPTGTFKTALGLMFALNMDKPAGGFAKGQQTETLVISAGNDAPDIQYLLKGKLVSRGSRLRKTAKDLRIRSLPGGYVKPGYILHHIEEEFLEARLAGRRSIDRVMINNVSHWGVNCPFIQEEQTFGDTLVHLLRRNQVTSLYTCNEAGSLGNSALQQSIIDTADCVIQIQRIVLQDQYHLMLRVLKTRGMKHRREAFELVFHSQRLDIRANESLLPVSADGNVEPLKIRMFLRHRSDAQKRLNKRLADSVRSAISRDVTIEAIAHDSSDLVQALSLRSACTLKELQILQIDEFHLPANQSKSTLVHVFGREQWNSQWDDMLPRLKNRVQVDGGKFFGVPIYQNIAFLAHLNSPGSGSPGQMGLASGSWVKLAEQGWEWERQNPDSSLLFFDFSPVTDEHYNSLFLEILFSTFPDIGKQNELSVLLLANQALQSARIYRRLCRRSHFAWKDQPTRFHHREAVVWRLWYSELNHMLSTMDLAQRERITVAPLPGNLSVAEECYLTIPAYSAAPDVGLLIMKLLATREAELSRLREGVGLPTHASFYSGLSSEDIKPQKSQAGKKDLGKPFAVDPDVPPISISPYFCLTSAVLTKTVDNALSRSEFSRYGQLSGVLAYHLKNVVELPEMDDIRMESEIRNLFKDFCNQARFIKAG